MTDHLDAAESRAYHTGEWLGHPLYECVHLGDVVPKARPRVTATGTFMPKRYSDYREALAWSLKLAAATVPLPTPLRLEVVVYRRDFGTADSDNLLGTALDAMKDAGLVEDDRWTILPDLRVRVELDRLNPRMEVRAWAL